MKTKDQDYQDFSNLPVWLPKKLEAAGLTPERFSQKINVSRTMVYAYLNDDARPSEQTALRMSHILKVPFEELLSQYVPKKVGNPHRSISELRVRRK